MEAFAPAWKLAGQPTDGVPFVLLEEGTDPTAYVLSANIHRRHITKSQKAMAVALIHQKPTAYKRGGSNSSETEELGSGRLSMARTVVHYSPDLAQSVLSGVVGLDKAYEEARRLKREGESLAARKAEIARVHPDLAAKVEEGELSVAAAEAEVQERARSFARQNTP